jgi:hypothetical protein
MARKLKMTDKVELSLQQLRSLFVAGEEFQEDFAENGEDATVPDFGDYIEKEFGIEIDI